MFILVTGASASGKSEYAEQRIVSLAGKNSPLIYLATMQPYGAEGAARVEKHRKQRAGRGFETLEWYRLLADAPIPAHSNLLLECMSNLTANELFDGENMQEPTVCEQHILDGVRHLRQHTDNLVIVTNEVFADTMRYDESTLSYIRLLGHINQALAVQADEVVEVVYGMPLFYQKGEHV